MTTCNHVITWSWCTPKAINITSTRLTTHRRYGWTSQRTQGHHTLLTIQRCLFHAARAIYPPHPATTFGKTQTRLTTTQSHSRQARHWLVVLHNFGTTFADRLNEKFTSPTSHQNSSPIQTPKQTLVVYPISTPMRLQSAATTGSQRSVIHLFNHTSAGRGHTSVQTHHQQLGRRD